MAPASRTPGQVCGRRGLVEPELRRMILELRGDWAAMEGEPQSDPTDEPSPFLGQCRVGAACLMGARYMDYSEKDRWLALGFGATAIAAKDKHQQEPFLMEMLEWFVDAPHAPPQ